MCEILSKIATLYSSSITSENTGVRYLLKYFCNEFLQMKNNLQDLDKNMPTYQNFIY